MYTLGSADPRSFSRGKRAIAGNCVFAVFDRDALLAELTEENAWNQIAPDAMFTAAGNSTTKIKDGNFENALSLSAWNRMTSASSGIGSSGDTVTNSISQNTAGKSVNVPQGFALINNQNVLYADTLPPLDVVMTFANEYGQAAFQKIYDLDFLNEGSGVSVDSIVMEREMSWIARRISSIMTGIYNSSEGKMSAKSVLQQ